MIWQYSRKMITDNKGTRNVIQQKSNAAMEAVYQPNALSADNQEPGLILFT
jgi:hypothetical protein